MAICSLSSHYAVQISNQPNIYRGFPPWHEINEMHQKFRKNGLLHASNLLTNVNPEEEMRCITRKFQSRVLWKPRSKTAIINERVVPLSRCRSVPPLCGCDDDKPWLRSAQAARFATRQEQAKNGNALKQVTKNYAHRVDAHFFMLGLPVSVRDRYSINTEKVKNDLTRVESIPGDDHVAARGCPEERPEKMPKSPSMPKHVATVRSKSAYRSPGKYGRTTVWKREWDTPTLTAPSGGPRNGTSAPFASRLEKRKVQSARLWGLGTTHSEVDPWAEKYKPKIPERGFLVVEKSEISSDEISSDILTQIESSENEEALNLLTEAQTEAFSAYFSRLDVHNCGMVSLRELLQAMCVPLDCKEAEKFVKMLDLNGNGTVDRREFVAICGLNDKLKGLITEDSSAQLSLDLDRLGKALTVYKEVFDLIDDDGDGRINLDEIMIVISATMPVSLETNQILSRQLMKAIHKDQRGYIDFTSFLLCLPFFLRLHKSLKDQPGATIEAICKAKEAIRLQLRQPVGSASMSLAETLST